MFLELIDKNSIFLSNKEFFPMSTEHAVAQTRGILKTMNMCYQILIL